MKQLTLQKKKTGRKAINDKGIRHISRDRIFNPTSLHLTIKVRENKADIKTKLILKALHHAIKRARLKRLRVIHYTLEYNHLHLLVECDNHKRLGKGMQAFGISIAKAINRIKLLKGAVYKHRYHLRKITSGRDLKNVLHYIFNNGIKHKRATSIIDPYNSSIAEKHLKLMYPKLKLPKSLHLSALQIELLKILEPGNIHFRGFKFLCLKSNHK